ncbi:MAG: hypothetical protein KBG64_05630 [Clostridia bacterium]|nr:hypothetical protein [Clostridia bacterium]
MNQQLRKIVEKTTREAEKTTLNPFFDTFSADRLAREYNLCEWSIGPLERLDELTFEKKTCWHGPWNIGWDSRALHNAALIEKDDALYMFYPCNPTMESLASRIGLAIYREKTGWVDWKDNPLIYCTEPHEALASSDPKIYKAEGKYFLFYQAEFPPTDEDRARYMSSSLLIGPVGTETSVAVSDDLIHWEKKGSIIFREISRLWAKGSVILRAANGEAVRINRKYMMFVSDGCGSEHNQAIGYSDDMLHWEFHLETYLDPSPIGRRVFEVMWVAMESSESDHMIMDFFYDGGSGISCAAQALYKTSEPTKQVELNRGGTLNAGGILKYRGRWMHA